MKNEIPFETIKSIVSILDKHKAEVKARKEKEAEEEKKREEEGIPF